MFHNFPYVGHVLLQYNYARLARRQPRRCTPDAGDVLQRLRDLHFFDVHWNTLDQKKTSHAYLCIYVLCSPQESRRRATKVEDPYCDFDVNRTEGSPLPNSSSPHDSPFSRMGHTFSKLFEGVNGRFDLLHTYFAIV